MANTLDLPRKVEPEMLDELAVADPRARRSREDLQRIHRAMATLSIMLRALDSATVGSTPRTILELGAGDGSLMLRLARRRAVRWPDVNLTLLDRLDLIDDKTLKGFHDVGWKPNVVTADISEWIKRPSVAKWDIVIANLFMHHFSAEALTHLLPAIAAKSRIFFCCEPRRSALPLAASHLVGLIGAGPITRQDAVLSVHAGFCMRELSAFWPAPDLGSWHLREYGAGLFSHALLASRTSNHAS